MRSVMKRLADVLDEYHYVALVQLVTSGRINHEPLTIAPKQAIAALPPPQLDLVRLFHTGEAVHYPQTWLGETLTGELAEIGFLIPGDKQGMWHTNGKMVVPVHGLYLITENYKSNHFRLEDDLVWLSRGSLFLVRSLCVPRGSSVLDLCSGTGILALTACAKAEKVVSVDINERAVTLAKWNAQLNDQDDKLNVLQGDLFAPIKNKKFDYIVANPPFIPLSSDGPLNYWFADGGNSGLELFFRIICELPRYMEEGGESMIYIGGYGDRSRPYLLDELETRTKQYRWKVEVVYLNKSSAEDGVAFLSREYPSMKHQILQAYEEYYSHATHFYLLLVYISAQERRASHKYGTLTILSQA